jgi:tRNA threonylcarbamoyladenosine biosynthesis protein TsaB
MNLLALDTSSNACSVALKVGDQLLEDHVIEPREHTKVLMPMISGLLKDAGVALSGLDAIVLGNGPGSFIGMRIGASVAQGLAFGAGLGIIPVSSLAAVAAEAMDSDDADCIVVAQDARMNEVYFGIYRKGAGKLPLREDEERICSVGELPLTGHACAAAGAAWERYPELMQANRARISHLVPVSCPRARYVLRIGETSGAVIAPESLAPAYLRTKVAEKPSPGN